MCDWAYLFISHKIVMFMRSAAPGSGLILRTHHCASGRGSLGYWEHLSHGSSQGQSDQRISLCGAQMGAGPGCLGRNASLLPPVLYCCSSGNTSFLSFFVFNIVLCRIMSGNARVSCSEIKPSELNFLSIYDYSVSQKPLEDKIPLMVTLTFSLMMLCSLIHYNL